jgi:hypothetical protein
MPRRWPLEGFPFSKERLNGSKCLAKRDASALKIRSCMAMIPVPNSERPPFKLPSRYR